MQTMDHYPDTKRERQKKSEIQSSSAQLSSVQARPGWARARPGIPIGYTRCLSRKGAERGRWRSERGKRVPNSKGASDRSFDGSCCLLITRFLGNAMRCTANGGIRRRQEVQQRRGRGGMASRSDWDPVAIMVRMPAAATCACHAIAART